MKDLPKTRGISITWVLMGGIGGIVALALAATVWLGVSTAAETTTTLLRERAAGIIDNLTDEVRRHMRPAALNSRFTADYFASLGRMPRGEDAAYLSTAMALHPQLRFSGYFSPNGTGFFYQRNGQSSVRTWRDDPQIARLMEIMRGQAGTYWRGPVYSVPLKQTIIPIANPVRRDGLYHGFAGTAVSIQALSRFVDSLDVSGGSAFILLGRDHVIAHPLLIDGFLTGLISEKTPLLNTIQTNDPVLQAFHNGEGEDLFILQDTDLDLKGRVFTIKDEEYVLLYRELTEFGEKPWLIGAYINTSKSGIDDVWRRLNVSIWISLGLMVTTLLVLVLIARRIRRPIRDLSAASNAVRNFEFSNIPPHRNSIVRELNEAGEAFQRMIDGLRHFETYVPKSLVLRIMRSEDARATASEERQITLMFTDIAGFTSMAEKMSAAETAALLNEHFTLMNACVEAEDGTVDKYIGDSMMAFWGAPEDQPDHAARGCRTILAIAEAVRADNKKRVARGELPFRIRIGLHAGPAIAGNIGAPGRVNYTVVGDTVNVANRLEQLGKEIMPDDDVVLLVSGDAAKMAGDGFEFADKGAFNLRGRETALSVLALLGSNPAP
jgi:adenylate cyclase